MTGHDLTNLRHKHQLTLRTLSRLLDCDISTISRWQAYGDRPLPTRITLALSTLLGKH